MAFNDYKPRMREGLFLGVHMEADIIRVGLVHLKHQRMRFPRDVCYLIYNDLLAVDLSVGAVKECLESFKAGSQHINDLECVFILNENFSLKILGDTWVMSDKFNTVTGSDTDGFGVVQWLERHMDQRGFISATKKISGKTSVNHFILDIIFALILAAITICAFMLLSLYWPLLTSVLLSVTVLMITLVAIIWYARKTRQEMYKGRYCKVFSKV